MIKLNNDNYLGQGSVKKIYQSESADSQIIKIIHPHLVSSQGGFKNQGFLKQKLFQGAYRQFRRELIQYLQLCKNHYGTGQFTFPVETPYGLVATDRGLGLVTEKIVAPDGKGWTLSQLVRAQGLELKHYQALERFFDDCVRLHIVFGEVNIAGIMYTESRNGRPEFVLVDGVGEKLLIPIRAMSSWISGRYVRKVQRRIMRDISALAHQRQG
nr:YrbL family protein [uncultured Comamonas sp.]